MAYRDEQDRMMRELKHKENLAILAEFCHCTPTDVMDFLRQTKYPIVEMFDAETGDVLSTNLDFRGAAEGLGEIAFAEWAVKRVEELKALRAVSS